MRAVTWQGREKVSVETVPDPTILEPTDAIIRVTSSAVCGSDLHLYGVLGPFLEAGDILGHEPMGIVEEVGAEVNHIQPGDRVVVPFQIACGTCFMCARGLQTQCETTQVREQGMGAALFGYTKLYGQVPGGQAEYLRVPQAHYGPIPVPDDGQPDERYLFLSDVVPTAWQAVRYAEIPAGGSVVVLGLGPIGQMCVRVARALGAETVIGVDLVPERLQMAARYGAHTLDLRSLGAEGKDGLKDVAVLTEVVQELTGGRGPDSVIDAVGMEAHGSPMAETVQKSANMLPDFISQPLFTAAGVDRLAALHAAISLVRRGGTISLSGVYGGMADPLPLMTLFDKQVSVRMGQANVRHWVDEAMPYVTDDADPLGTLDLRTHRMSLEDGAEAYATFQAKEDGAIKIVLDPALPAGTGGRRSGSADTTGDAR